MLSFWIASSYEYVELSLSKILQLENRLWSTKQMKQFQDWRLQFLKIQRYCIIQWRKIIMEHL